MVEPQTIAAFDNVTVRWRDRCILKALSFSVYRPGVTVLLGPNGAGKSTLIQVLLGLREPTSGTVTFAENSLADPLSRRSILGAVLQNEGTFEGATVGEYATLFAALHQRPELRETILTMAKLAPSVKHSQRVESLSGGEQRRLQLAAALAHDPVLLVLDEPTNHLDPVARRQMLVEIQSRAKTTAILLATHDLLETSAIADFVLILVGGELVAQGSKASLIASLPVHKRPQGLSAVFAHFTGASL